MFVHFCFDFGFLQFNSWSSVDLTFKYFIFKLTKCWYLCTFPFLPLHLAKDLIHSFQRLDLSLCQCQQIAQNCLQRVGHFMNKNIQTECWKLQMVFMSEGCHWLQNFKTFAQTHTCNKHKKSKTTWYSMVLEKSLNWQSIIYIHKWQRILTSSFAVSTGTICNKIKQLL